MRRAHGDNEWDVAIYAGHTQRDVSPAGGKATHGSSIHVRMFSKSQAVCCYAKQVQQGGRQSTTVEVMNRRFLWSQNGTAQKTT